MVDLRHGIADVESSLPEDMTLAERRRARATETYARGTNARDRGRQVWAPDSRSGGFSKGGRDAQPPDPNLRQRNE